MIFAIIKDNVVQNVIIAEQDFIDKVYPGAIDVTNLDTRPSFGWIYDGETFTAPVKDEAETL